MKSMRDGAFGSELTFDEFVIIELLLREIQSANVRLLGPTGLLIGTTFGTGFGIGRNFSAAVRANLGTHAIPAYSSSVFRLSPMRT